MPAAVLEVRLGDRSRRPEVLRRRSVGPRGQSGGGGHRLPLGAVVCEAVAGCPAVRPDGALEQRSKGTPQGSAVSPILANLFMHYAFDLWMARNLPGCPFERYADDAIVHCKTRRQAEHVLARIAQADERGWADASPGEDADRLLQGRSAPGAAPAHRVHLPRVRLPGTGARSRDGRIFTGFLPAISPEALKAKSVELRAMRIHRRTDLSLDDLARWLNPIAVRVDQRLRPVLPDRARIPSSKRVNVDLRRWAGRNTSRCGPTSASAGGGPHGLEDSPACSLAGSAPLVSVPIRRAR